MKLLLFFSVYLTLLINSIGQQSFSMSIDIDQSIDEGVAVRTVENGYLLLAGPYCFSNSTQCYSYMKTDTEGNVVWEKQLTNYPRVIKPQDGFGNHGIATNPDVQGIFYAGVIGNISTGLDFFLMRTDENGDSLWLKSYGGTLSELTGSVIYKTDSTLLLFGDRYIHSTSEKIYIIEVDLNGKILSQNLYGEEYSMVGRQDIIKLPNGDIVFTYLSCTSGQTCVSGSKQLMMTRIDSDGKVLWTREIYSFTDHWSNSNVVALDNGGFLISFHRTNYDNGWWFPPILLWADSSGNVTSEYFFPSDRESIINDLILTSSGIVIGVGYNDLFELGIGGWIFALSQDGEFLWNRTIIDEQFPIKAMTFNAVDIAADNGFILTGLIIDTVIISGNVEPDWNIWLVKLDSAGCYHAMCNEVDFITLNFDKTYQKPVFKLFPNPVTDELYLKNINEIDDLILIRIWSLTGSLINEYDLSQQSMPINVSHIPGGMYFVQLILKNNSSSAWGSIIIER